MVNLLIINFLVVFCAYINSSLIEGLVIITRKIPPTYAQTFHGMAIAIIRRRVLLVLIDRESRRTLIYVGRDHPFFVMYLLD